MFVKKAPTKTETAARGCPVHRCCWPRRHPAICINSGAKCRSNTGSASSPQAPTPRKPHPATLVSVALSPLLAGTRPLRAAHAALGWWRTGTAGGCRDWIPRLGARWRPLNLGKVLCRVPYPLFTVWIIPIPHGARVGKPSCCVPQAQEFAAPVVRVQERCKLSVL